MLEKVFLDLGFFCVYTSGYNVFYTVLFVTICCMFALRRALSPTLPLSRPTS